MRTLRKPPLEFRTQERRGSLPAGAAFIVALPLGIAFWSALILAMK
jgi:hypothetical protein